MAIFSLHSNADSKFRYTHVRHELSPLSDKNGGERSKYASIAKDMSHEFQVHHLLNELVSLLHVRGADVDVDSYADVLLKNRTPYVTTQVCVYAL